METKDNKVTFELDEITLKKFELAMLMLNKSGDELFKQFIDSQCYHAMRRSMFGSSGETYDSSSTRNVSRLPMPDRIKRRIEVWASRPNYVNYNIIKSFFKAYDADESHFVSRAVMQRLYVTFDFVHPDRSTEDVFIRNFRMMCSDSAYGCIFKYTSENDEVKMNPEIESYLLERKNIFTSDVVPKVENNK